jgi:hypothetical protein
VGGFQVSMPPGRVRRCWHMTRVTTLLEYRFPPAHSSDDGRVIMLRSHSRSRLRVLSTEYAL